MGLSFSIGITGNIKSITVGLRFQAGYLSPKSSLRKPKGNPSLRFVSL